MIYILHSVRRIKITEREMIRPGAYKYRIDGCFAVLLFAVLFAIMMNASSAKASGDIDSCPNATIRKPPMKCGIISP